MLQLSKTSFLIATIIIVMVFIYYINANFYQQSFTYFNFGMFGTTSENKSEVYLNGSFVQQNETRQKTQGIVWFASTASLDSQTQAFTDEVLKNETKLPWNPNLKNKKNNKNALFSTVSHNGQQATTVAQYPVKKDSNYKNNISASPSIASSTSQTKAFTDQEFRNITKVSWNLTETSLIVSQNKDSTTSNYPKPKENSLYKINTAGCNIRYLDPWHPSITHLVAPVEALKCTGNSLVKQNGSRLKIDKQVAKKMALNFEDIDCYYNPIIRDGNNKSDNSYKIVSKKIQFKDNTIIPHEFLKVTCNVRKSTVYTDYFAFIIKKPAVEERCKKAKPRKRSETFRIVLIGMDSVSKSQFLRQMKKTNEYIKRNLDAIELHGYTKIGLNTFPNVVAMLANKTEDQLPNMSTTPANVIPLIWNDLAEEGYRTLYAEDIPSITMFNYAKIGFHEQPTDYYLRPFSWAVEHSSLIKNAKRGCWKDRLEASVILKWSMDFLNKFANEKLFSLTFLTRLSHDYLNEVGHHDEPYLQHLQQLKDNGHFNNSFVFYFGDHGFRFGSMRATYIGRMEDMLPFYFLIVPPWFKEKYPIHYKNLKTNERRLTTAFDIFATIVDIKNFTGQTETQHFSSRGISLFTEIPETRTCKDASIPLEYCTCAEENNVALNDSIVIEGAKKLVERINNITKAQRDKCAILTYYNVTDARKQIVTSDKVKSETITIYRISVNVEPSKGLFEGIIWFAKDINHSTIEKQIDRINKYGNQSFCVTELKLKPYCYCENS